MKSKIFKIVLPAFALMLAITASLAFTSVENDAAEQTPLEGWYLNNDTPPVCTKVITTPPGSDVNCQTSGADVCTLFIPGQGLKTIYADNQCDNLRVLFRIGS
ncbi:DUF6520 family protein [Flavivirga spongiicola]|uniref:DUF6520 family protein n=1 Tax=Flavivirga spongiicola TaxID=421621 RepID=A0ABU7XTE7_9FLAO|nr:DUF6520 family protein [Flavivirga sp. MEBiC05379]MDO5978209.1 DUF6520 family protein [Flavivirga sp. MEBiC05379]